MNRPDESLIRDADLREQLEQARGQFAFEITVRSLITTQERRDAEAQAAQEKAAKLAAMPREKRRRAIVREVFENAAPTPNDIRHIHSVLAICGMPTERQPMEVREFEKKQGNMALDVSAGFLRDPNGNKVQQPLPFGPKARLLMMHLCSEAIRQKSATVEIADSLTGFVRDMDFSDSGGKKGPLTAFKEQINALAACTMRVSAWDGSRSRSRLITPFESIDVWLPLHPDQRMLWPSTITFSESMFRSLEKHALPVNAKAVKAFAGSARKLDLYFWLGWRMHNIEVPLNISWTALAEQFGGNFSRHRDFIARFSSELAAIQEVFPKLPATLSENGLTLRPAGPEVLSLPAPRPISRKR